MEERNASNISRWVIPGWLFLIAILFYYIIDLYIQGLDINHIIENELVILFIELTSMTDIGQVVTTLLIAGSGVPIGFIVFQIYYFFRWSSPFSKNGGPLPLISGRIHEVETIKEGVDIDKIKRHSLSKKALFDRRDTDSELRVKWNILDLIFLEGLNSFDGTADLLYKKYRYLHDVNHILGASLTAVTLAFLLYLTQKIVGNFIFEPPMLFNYISLAHMVLITLAIFFFLREEDRKYWKCFQEKIIPTKKRKKINVADWEKRLKEIPVYIIPTGKEKFLSISQPGSISVVTLLLIHVFFNKRFAAVNSTLEFALFSLGLVILAIIIWILPKHKSMIEDGIRGDSTVIFIIALIIGLVRLIKPFHNFFRVNLIIDWATFTTFSVFIWFAYVLYKNQKNAVKEMLILHNYVLREISDKLPSDTEPYESEKQCI